jgi:AraC family transcriptional regulator
MHRSSENHSESPDRVVAGSTSKIVRSISTHGFSFREHYVEARAENPRHAHEYQCIGFILDGLGTAEFGRESWTVRPGDLNLIPAGIPHRERFGSPHVRWCSLELLTPPTDCADIARQAFSRPLQHSRGPANEIARRIVAELRLADGVSPLALCGLGLELLAVTARIEREPGLDQRAGWLRRVEEQLRTRCCEALSFAQIASESGVHPSHLARVFRRAMGCSVGEFVRIQRIERAKGWLAARELTLAQIADRTGFSDQSHFTRAFKLVTGTTPAAYRNTFRTR